MSSPKMHVDVDLTQRQFQDLMIDLQDIEDPSSATMFLKSLLELILDTR
jgi:hypothetical protein